MCYLFRERKGSFYVNTIDSSVLYTLLHIQSLTVNFHSYKFYSKKAARTHGGGTHANLGSFLSRASRLQDFTRPLFPRGLFTVSLNGLSEKATTRSQVSRQLNLRSKQTNEQVARFPERCATVHTFVGRPIL